MAIASPPALDDVDRRSPAPASLPVEDGDLAAFLAEPLGGRLADAGARRRSRPRSFPSGLACSTSRTIASRKYPVALRLLSRSQKIISFPFWSSSETALVRCLGLRLFSPESVPVAHPSGLLPLTATLRGGAGRLQLSDVVLTARCARSRRCQRRDSRPSPRHRRCRRSRRFPAPRCRT